MPKKIKITVLFVLSLVLLVGYSRIVEAVDETKVTAYVQEGITLKSRSPKSIQKGTTKILLNSTNKSENDGYWVKFEATSDRMYKFLFRDAKYDNFKREDYLNTTNSMVLVAYKYKDGKWSKQEVEGALKQGYKTWLLDSRYNGCVKDAIYTNSYLKKEKEKQEKYKEAIEKNKSTKYKTDSVELSLKMTKGQIIYFGVLVDALDTVGENGSLYVDIE